MDLCQGIHQTHDLAKDKAHKVYIERAHHVTMILVPYMQAPGIIIQRKDILVFRVHTILITRLLARFCNAYETDFGTLTTHCTILFYGLNNVNTSQGVEYIGRGQYTGDITCLGVTITCVGCLVFAIGINCLIGVTIFFNGLRCFGYAFFYCMIYSSNFGNMVHRVTRLCTPVIGVIYTTITRGDT